MDPDRGTRQGDWLLVWSLPWRLRLALYVAGLVLGTLLGLALGAGDVWGGVLPWGFLVGVLAVVAGEVAWRRRR